MGLMSQAIADPSAYRPGLTSPGRAEREAMFGKFEYQDVAGQDDIVILGNWQSQNIVRVHIPQLQRVKKNPYVHFHKNAQYQLIRLFRDWETAGLLHLIRTWEGSFVPRYKRKSAKRKYIDLSNHSFGSAFDINYHWNKLGEEPALMGQKGCVRELVPIANYNGFFWGGHYNRRKDGMHFEVAQLQEWC